MLMLLDSTVLIDCLRGRPAMDRVDRLWGTGDTPATSPLNVEEVVRGMRTGEEEDIRRFIGSLHLLPVSAGVAWQSGTWRSGYASRGVTLHQADCLVAATALVHGARLCTGNPKDFPMPGLDLEHWPVGA